MNSSLLLVNANDIDGLKIKNRTKWKYNKQILFRWRNIIVLYLACFEFMVYNLITPFTAPIYHFWGWKFLCNPPITILQYGSTLFKYTLILVTLSYLNDFNIVRHIATMFIPLICLKNGLYIGCGIYIYIYIYITIKKVRVLNIIIIYS